MIAYNDPFVHKLADDIGTLVEGGTVDTEDVRERLLELAIRNCSGVKEYFRRTEHGRGIPDTAFKGESPYFFPDVEPSLTFATSGTSMKARGVAHYTPVGEALLRATILRGAREHLIGKLDRPVFVRLVPSPRQAPQMVIAYGMELIATDLGDPARGGCVIAPEGLDIRALEQQLDAAMAADQPVVLMGSSFAFVNACDALRSRSKSWELPEGSRMVDAGGFKGRSRVVTVDTLRGLAGECFGIEPSSCTNIFGMTELASQLYDGADIPVGPLGQRPRARASHVWARVRSPHDMTLTDEGPGLLEIVDLAILDRPCTVLSGDLALADAHGVTIVDRIQHSAARGCSLTMESTHGTAGGRS